jgi:hypoxanthine phosphoribosyltransferase
VHADIDKVLITRARIAERVAQLGAEIARDLDAQGEPREVVIVPVLMGSIIFVADLVRHLPHKLRIGLVTVSSYPGRATASQGAEVKGTLPENLEGRHVLIVDDVLDSGLTLRLLRAEVERRRPASMRACVLLRKMVPSALETRCEYVGFDIPDVFVVGYGLDYNNYYRNLPDIGTLRNEALT